jgi:hypothetical protein
MLVIGEASARWQKRRKPTIGVFLGNATWITQHGTAWSKLMRRRWGGGFQKSVVPDPIECVDPSPRGSGPEFAPSDRWVGRHLGFRIGHA